MEQTQDYLTVPQVAKKMGVTAKTVRNWIKKGTLSGVKTINKVHYIPANFIDTLDEQKGE